MLPWSRCCHAASMPRGGGARGVGETETEEQEKETRSWMLSQRPP